VVEFEIVARGRVVTVDVYVSEGLKDQIYLMSTSSWYPLTIEDVRENIIDICWGPFLTAVRKFTETAIDKRLRHFYIISGAGEFYVVDITSVK
jgi:hypothetical protein